MSLRFRRTITLAPGLRLNLGKRGASLSAGPRGASVTFGRNGLFGNVGIPGTGLSYRTRLGGNRRSAPKSGPADQKEYVPVGATVSDTGELVLTDPDGGPLSDEMRAEALRRNKSALIDILDQRAKDLNDWLDRMLRPHLETPGPEASADLFLPNPFRLPKPEKPEPEEVGLVGSWFGGRERAEARYQKDLADYRAAIAEWRAAEENHRVGQETAANRHALWRSGDPDAARDRIEERLGAISWPRETLISYQQSGQELQADIDLPEIEDMPAETAKVRRRDMRMEMTEKGETERRREYALHVHAIGFRVAGEAFAAMPGLRSVLVSGYSQRVSRASGRVEDEYLYSVRIDRAEWRRIDFSKLDMVDPVEALSRFDLRRDMTRTGIFRPVDPIG